MSRLAILGAGSWGTALAITLAPRFETVRLWARNPDTAGRHLPGFRLPGNVQVSAHLADALRACDIVIIAIPCAYLRGVLRSVGTTSKPVVSATKGIEEGTLLRVSEVIREMLPYAAVVVLSGPTFAREVAAGEPAAVVIASEEIALAEEIQRAFATPSLRLYASSDVVGVELGAALKNVIAIGAGICRGLGLGSNIVAALITRGLAEMTRLAVSQGGQPRTLAGLAGLGDLVLTATGDLSRNRFVGVRLGEGRKLEEILAGMTMVAEGVGTCRAAYELGHRSNVDLPITNKMYEVLYESKDPRQAIRELMDRPLTTE
jgi:glycerol-3-phosphate dehydrogenase (NAD(P)+)